MNNSYKKYIITINDFVLVIISTYLAYIIRFEDLEIISTLSINYHISPTSVLASMRDRTSTNNVALRTLKVLYPNIVDIGCLSHTIDHVGEKFDTAVLSEFISWWINLFSHSPKKPSTLA